MRYSFHFHLNCLKKTTIHTHVHTRGSSTDVRLKSSGQAPCKVTNKDAEEPNTARQICYYLAHSSPNIVNGENRNKRCVWTVSVPFILRV